MSTTENVTVTVSLVWESMMADNAMWPRSGVNLMALLRQREMEVSRREGGARLATKQCIPLAHLKKLHSTWPSRLLSANTVGRLSAATSCKCGHPMPSTRLQYQGGGGAVCHTLQRHNYTHEGHLHGLKYVKQAWCRGFQLH